jgi:hypothetical protein
MTCEHVEMRWLDCDGCKDKGITCDARVCVDCGAAIYDVPVPHASIKELHTAMEIGEHRERERIVKMFEDRVSRLEQMRPESYKSVADTADLRIRTYRHIIKLINGEQSSEPER